MTENVPQTIEAWATALPGVIYSFRLRHDGTAHFPFMSEHTIELLGVDPHECNLNAAPAFALVHKEDCGRLWQSVLGSARHMAPWQCEFRIWHPVKGCCWIQGKRSPPYRSFSMTSAQ